MVASASGEGVRGVRGEPRECKVCGEVKPYREFVKGHSTVWTCRECRNDAKRVRGRAAKWDRNPRLPAGPFREWLDGYVEGCRRELEFEARWAGVPVVSSTGTGLAAVRLGMDEARVRRILNGESQNVSLGAVDRVCVRLGDPGLLNRLYPIEEGDDG